MADVDHFNYAEEQCVEVIKEMLAEKSNDMAKYEYLSHELQFHETEQLSGVEFESRLEDSLEREMKKTLYNPE